MKEGLEVRLLGPPVVVRDGAPVALPRSRKVITLLALLALDGVPHSRSRLCDLLWDLPNDPRAELRWCLSKLRAVVDQPPRRRIVTKGNTLVALDLAGVCFDCAEVQGERVNATTEQLAQWARRFRGDLLEGCDVDGGAELASWLAAGRQRFRALRLAIVEELARRPGPPEEMARRVDEWLQLAPFDERAQRHFEDDAGLGKLACFHPCVVTIRLGIGVIANPRAVAGAQFVEVVIPVRAEAEGIADERAQQGACGTVFK